MAAALQQSGKRAALNLAQQILSPIADRTPTLVFLGPPGVGKGTYSSRIARQLGLAHVSVGDLIRSEIDAGTSSGKAVRFPLCDFESDAEFREKLLLVLLLGETSVISTSNPRSMFKGANHAGCSFCSQRRLTLGWTHI